jgi:hypothetical protein
MPSRKSGKLRSELFGASNGYDRHVNAFLIKNTPSGKGGVRMR